MVQPAIESRHSVQSRYRRHLVGMAAWLLLSASPPLVAAEAVIEVGPAARSRVPLWDTRGTGPLPAQAVACLDMSDDGRFVLVGTLAPPGGPNLLLLDGGKIIGRHRAGLRWVNEVTVSNDGRLLGGLSTTPEGTAGDGPRYYAFHQGKELPRLSEKFNLPDFRPGGCLFHYGDHSNHLPRVARRAGNQWVIAGDDQLHWLSPDNASLAHQAPLGHGQTTALAVSAGGRAVVGRFGGTPSPKQFRDLLVLEPGRLQPIVWSRPAGADAAPSPRPEKGVYGPPAPPYEDVRFQAPLAVAIDASGDRVAVADYEGWQRVFRPRDGGDEVPFGVRFMPSRPTIHVYDSLGKVVRRIGPEAFPDAFWCDLAFSGDGRTLLLWPHNWTSRGLAGQPFLPADATARTLYALDIAGGELQAVRFPDAISSVDLGGEDRIAVSCWDHRVYLLGKDFRPVPGLAQGLDVGAAGLVRVSKEGRRTVVATAAGAVRMLDAGGNELWRTDLNAAARAVAGSETRKEQPGKIGPDIWRTNGGMAHSDLGSQFLIAAPRGLILIDPNAGASFAQNWARIEAAGLDPMQVKYVLLTHEHGDHAPGAYLWRVITGAKVVASAEMAYTCSSTTFPAAPATGSTRPSRSTSSWPRTRNWTWRG